MRSQPCRAKEVFPKEPVSQKVQESPAVRYRSSRPTIPIPLCPNDLKLQIVDHAQQKQIDRGLRKRPPSPTLLRILRRSPGPTA